MISVRDAFALAFKHEAAGRSTDALAIYERILAAIPDHPGALFKIAEHEQKSGRPEAARALLQRAVGAAETQALPGTEISMALARLEIERGDRDAAQRALETAQAAGCTAPDLPRLLAWLALERGDAPQALAIARGGLALRPRDAELLHLVGKALRASGALTEARTALEEAVDVSKGDPGMLVTLGAICIDLGLAREARGHLVRAIDGGEETATTWDNYGLACFALGDMDEAARAFERSTVLDPKLTPALSNLVTTLRHACRWDDAETREGEWLAGLEEPRRDPRWNPFLAVTLATTSAQQLAIARSWSRHVLPAVAAPAVIAARGTRLRIGYLSSDFREHPTSRLVAGHVERHDRARFDVFAYSHGPEDGSAIRARVQAAFAHWVEARAMSDLQLAQRIRDDGIDVLIDLDGHTHGDRLGVLARRPAPLQLHYLGFPGTLGFDGIDGLIADAVVVPPEEDRHFHERVLRLPRCYQVNDAGRSLPPPASRATLGIPEGSLVLACFNQVYKLTRAYFRVWMDVLVRVPDALLWLYAPAPLAQANLRAEAARHGVDPHRILFATKVGYDEHIARLRVADLSLDVAPCNSHTTGSDSLWAGVPMLSCKGTTFAGRVGESLLAAVGQRELVMDTLDAYHATLHALAADRTRLRGYREHLERERHRLPLFDTEGFTRDFEALLADACSDGGGRRTGD